MKLNLLFKKKINNIIHQQFKNQIPILVFYLKANIPKTFNKKNINYLVAFIKSISNYL